MGIVTVRTSFIQYSITYTQGRYSSQGLLEEPTLYAEAQGYCIKPDKA